MKKMISWTIPSQEEAEEFSRAFLDAQNAYYEEHMDDCCGTCEHYENGTCYLDIGEHVDYDYKCKFFIKAAVS